VCKNHFILQSGFHVGANLSQHRVWTSALDFMPGKPKEEVHYVNSDSKIHLESCSRLDIFDKKEVKVVLIIIFS